MGPLRTNQISCRNTKHTWRKAKATYGLWVSITQINQISDNSILKSHWPYHNLVYLDLFPLLNTKKKLSLSCRIWEQTFYVFGWWVMSYGGILVNLCNQVEPITMSNSHQVKHPLNSQQFSLFFSFFSLSFFLLHCYSFFSLSFYSFYISSSLHTVASFFLLRAEHIAHYTRNS